MNKKSAIEGHTWTAAHRYKDVFECDNGTLTLSHSVKGLEAAVASLELSGDESALKQLSVVNAKLDAIKRAGKPAPPVETETGEE